MDYLELLKELNLGNYLIKEIDAGQWHFTFGYYHFEAAALISSESGDESKFGGYGRMQMDIDIFGDSKEECAKKAYLTLRRFRDGLFKIGSVDAKKTSGVFKQ